MTMRKIRERKGGDAISEGNCPRRHAKTRGNVEPIVDCIKAAICWGKTISFGWQFVKQQVIQFDLECRLNSFCSRPFSASIRLASSASAAVLHSLNAANHPLCQLPGRIYFLFLFKFSFHSSLPIYAFKIAMNFIGIFSLKFLSLSVFLNSASLRAMPLFKVNETWNLKKVLDMCVNRVTFLYIVLSPCLSWLLLLSIYANLVDFLYNSRWIFLSSFEVH